MVNLLDVDVIGEGLPSYKMDHWCAVDFRPVSAQRVQHSDPAVLREQDIGQVAHGDFIAAYIGDVAPGVGAGPWSAAIPCRHPVRSPGQ